MRRGRTIGVAIAALVVLGAAIIVWYLSREPVAPVDISAGGSEATSAGPSSSVGSLDDLTGDWTVVASVGGDVDSGSFVGYRVDEELSGIGAATAVGRTPKVTVTMTIDDRGIVSATTIEADMTQLTSDQSFRDQAIQRQGLETADLPTGAFTLDEPIEIPDEALDGTTVTVPATGTLTLHGVDQRVQVDLDARLEGDQIVVGGSIPISMSDYDMQAPQAQRVISIDDDGTAELQLFFGRAEG